MYLEMEIKGQVYQFNFGIGFMREMDKKVKVPVEGMKGVEQAVGLRYCIANVLDGNIDALIDVLYASNKGFEPRLKMSDIEDFLEDPDTDIDSVFEEVIDFFKRANVTKKVTQGLLE